MWEKLKKIYQKSNEFLSVINKPSAAVISVLLFQGLGRDQKIFPNSPSFVREVFVVFVVFLFWFILALILRLFGAGRDETACFYCNENMPLENQFCGKCGRPRLIYRPLSIIVGLITILLGVLVILLGVYPLANMQQGSQLSVIFGAMVLVFGMLAMAQKRWAIFIITVNYIFQLSYLFIGSSRYIEVYLLLLIMPILSLFSFFTEYHSLKSKHKELPSK